VARKKDEGVDGMRTLAHIDLEPTEVNGFHGVRRIAKARIFKDLLIIPGGRIIPYARNYPKHRDQLDRFAIRCGFATWVLMIEYLEKFHHLPLKVNIIDHDKWEILAQGMG
jgi:hypothetical protein